MTHPLWQRRLLLAAIGLFALSLIGATLISSVHWINKPFPGFFLHENQTVGPYFLPGWSGEAGGLRSLDQIVGVNGTPIGQRGDLYALVRNYPAGFPVRYRLIRNGQPVELTIRTMTLSLQDWLLSFGVYVVIGIAFLGIGAAPYYFRASSPAALPLCLMVLAVFVWFQTTFDFVTLGVLPKEMRIFGMTLTPAAAVHLALLLKTGKPMTRSHPGYLVLIYGVALTIGWLNSATFFGNIETWIYVFRTTYLFTLVGALIFLGVIWSALHQPLPGLERSRLRVMLAGAFLGFLIPTLSTVLTSSFKWPIPYNIALVPTVCFPLSVAYALLKYSLFDLGNVLKVALSRIALTALLLAMYGMVVFLLGSWVGIYDNGPIVPFLFSVLVVLFFNPLLGWIEAVVDRYIYRQEYEPAEVQKEVSLFLRCLASPPTLAKGFIRLVTDRMGIETVSLAYHPQEAAGYFTAASDGVEQNSAVVSEAVQILSDSNGSPYYHGISRGEVTTNPLFRQNREAMFGIFNQTRSELLMPLIFQHEIRGLVCFGARRSRTEYSAEDLRLLVTLTDQLALSLENGRLYEESVKAYNTADASNKRLVEMDQVKKHFVANICHELRTPVSTIIGFSELLLDPSFTGDSRAMLNRLVNNGQELARLMDNLLNFSRMEADTVCTQFERVKLNEVLKALEMMTQRLIRERPIEFRINMESPIEIIESDGQKLQQILAQLLTNAVKFTQKGKIEVSVRTVPNRGGESVEIAVADTGIGIEKKNYEVIFEEFRQLDGSSTRAYGGTGVGLSLCQKLARALGGNLSVTSELGIGSVFRLLLPLMPQQRTSGVA
jgi:signal transduction histidine kinase